MKLPTLKELLTDTSCSFSRFRKGELIYTVHHNTLDMAKGKNPQKVLFEFPVPVSDTGDGVFNATEKSMTLMRYIRKALENAKEDVDG
jgi:hypothetical protein